MSQHPATDLAIAVDSIRDFNHASGGARDDWQYPGHAYDAVGNLVRLTGMLSQAVQQSAWPVLETHERGLLTVEGGGLPERMVRELVAARDDAMRAAVELTAAVQRMHAATGTMGLDITELQDN